MSSPRRRSRLPPPRRSPTPNPPSVATPAGDRRPADRRTRCPYIRVRSAAVPRPFRRPRHCAARRPRSPRRSSRTTRRRAGGCRLYGRAARSLLRPQPKSPVLLRRATSCPTVRCVRRSPARRRRSRRTTSPFRGTRPTSRDVSSAPHIFQPAAESAVGLYFPAAAGFRQSRRRAAAPLCRNWCAERPSVRAPSLRRAACRRLRAAHCLSCP